VVAGLFASIMVGVSLRHPAPQAVLPAAFPSSTGLLGYWTADAQTLAGTGPALDGTPSYVDGPSGKAFNLTAGTLSSTGLAPVSDAVSVMMWVKPSNVGSVMTLASRSTGPGMLSSLDDRHSFDLWLDPIGALVWQTDDVGARVPEELRVSVPTIFDGQYHLVAATWDTTAFNIYMDGALVATKKSQGGPLNAAVSTPFSFGGPFPYTGAIDEPAAWSRVLTANEIGSYYYTIKPPVTVTIPVVSISAIKFEGNSLWVSHAGGVSRINPTTNTVTETVTVGYSSHAVAFDGTSIWVATSTGVAKINPATNTVIATLDLQDTLGVYAVAFDGTSIWVTGETGNCCTSGQTPGRVSKINPTTNTVTATRSVGYRPIGMAFDGTSIWVIDQTGGVYQINATTNIVTAGFGVGGRPYAITFDGTSIWVAATAAGSSGTVSKINPTTNTVDATVFVDGFPFNFPFELAFDGTSIWISNAGGLLKINPTTNTVTATITVGQTTRGLAFDGTSIWVVTSSGTVLKIPV